MDGPCATELLAAEACVVADPATCSCFSQPFNETFPSEVGGAYRTTMAFEIPGSDMFCEVANENVCIKLEASGTCCCTKEVHEFITCSFTSDWNVQFAAGDCVFNKCSTADESEGSSGGSSMMIIIIAIVLTLLLCCCCCCCGCYFYRRRRNALATSAGESTSKDTKQDDSEHSWGDRDVESNGDLKKKNKDKKKKSKRHRNDSHHDSDFSSDESESYRNDRRKLKKQGHKKRNYDSDDSDVESRESQQRRTDKKRSGRKGYSSHEDTDSDQSRGRHKGKRIGSRKHLDDSDSDLDYESSYRPNKKYEPRSKTAYRNDDDLERPSVEESVRQARSILKTVKQTEKSANGGVPVEVQQVMNAELSAMIAQLREQKQEMERRLRESEIEATKLRLEKEASQRQIVELETRTVETQKSLQTTKNEARNLQANQTLEVATREAETIKVSAELEQVRKERLEMSKMIQKLEAARESMKDKLKQAQEESIVLRTENSEATKKINAVEKDREELQKRLAQIQQTRTDVERRLQDAAKEANVLKALKKVKAHEIREERASTHVRESYLNEMESERRGISKNLKMMEQEKKEMMVMMDQLDSSRHRLNSLMEEASGMVVEVETKNDESISLHDAITSGNQVAASATNSSDNPSSPVRPARYHQPSLATIHSPRHLMSTPTLSKVVSLTNLERFPTTVDSHLVVGGTENVVWKEKMQRTVSAKSLQDARPSGWLGEDIFNRSCNEMGSLGQRRRREPTEHARTSTGSCNASGDQIPPSATETELLRLKRDKARQSERRLRSEMQKSRSNQSLNSSVHSFDP